MSRDINKSFQSEIDKAAFIKQKIEESAGSSSAGGGAFANSESGIYWSNFYTDVPDAIMLPDSAGNENILNLNQLLLSDEIYYEARYFDGGHKYISFKNDDIGEVGAYQAGIGGAVTNLSGILDEGRALYYGGSSSGGGGSSGGIGSAQAIKDVSNFAVDLPDALYVDSATVGLSIAYLNHISSSYVVYRVTNTNANVYLTFNNDSSGKLYSETNVDADAWSTNTSIQGYIDAGKAIYTGGSSSSGGGGSSTFAALTDTPTELTADKYLKVNTEGTALELVDAPVSSGGGSSGGAGSSAEIKSRSNFNSTLPDAIQLFYNSNPIILRLASFVSSGENQHYLIRYELGGGSTNISAYFLNNSSATFSNASSSVKFSPEIELDTTDHSIESLIDSGRAIYYGGGSSSSGGSSTFAALTDTPPELTADKYLKVNTEGTALELVDAPVGSGGGSSGGGVGNLDYIKNQTSFNGILPDAIMTIGPDPNNWYTLMHFYDYKKEIGIFYKNTEAGIMFSDNSTGDIKSPSGTHTLPSGLDSIQKLIDNGHAIYYGGSSSGGIGSNQLVTNKSNFYTSLPDVLLITHSTGSLGSFFLNWIENDYVYYQLGLIESADPIPAIIRFVNNNQGTFEEIHNATTDNFPNAENSISEHLAAGRGIYYGGSSSSGGSSTFAALTDTPPELTADKYLKVNTEGTALELVDAPVGSGGGSSGGAGSLQVIKDKSNFYTDLPDAIVWPHTPISTGATSRAESILHLRFVHSEGDSPGLDIFYESRDVGQGGAYLGFTFKNNADGEYNYLYWSNAHFQDAPDSNVHSLRWFIENNRAIYYGGGSSSSGGIGDLPEIIAQSNFDGVLPDRIILTDTTNQVVPYTLSYVKSEYIEYAFSADTVNTNLNIRFNNNPSGTLKLKNTGHTLYAGDTTLQDIIDNNHAIYLGGGSSSSGGGGSSTFAALTDTPPELTADKYLKVNTEGTALELVDAPVGSGGSGGGTLSVAEHPRIKELSNFNGALPDVIFSLDTAGTAEMTPLYLRNIHESIIYYSSIADECFISFNNDADGKPTTNTVYNISRLAWGRSLRDFIDDGNALFGGGEVANTAEIQAHQELFEGVVPFAISALTSNEAGRKILYLDHYGAGGGSEDYFLYSNHLDDLRFAVYFKTNTVTGEWLTSSTIRKEGDGSLASYIANGHAFYFGGGSSSSGGSSTFAALTDTPPELTADKYLKVNTEGTALELVDAPVGSGGGSSVAVANYVGDGEEFQEIILGFRPAVVHVQCLSGPYYGTQTQIDGMEDENIYLYNSGGTTGTTMMGVDDAIEITDTGFKVYLPANNSGMNHLNSNYSYYALAASSSGGAEEGYLLDQFLGFINSGASHSVVLDGKSEYLVTILNRNPNGGSYPYAPLWHNFNIDSSDGTISPISDPGSNKVSTSYDNETDTLTIGANSCQIYEVKVFRKVQVGGGGGPSTFAALTDTPPELTADKYLKVNTEGTALELVDAPVGSGGGSSVVVGNYTGDGSDPQTIELGFRPAVVHIQCTSADYYGSQTQIDGMGSPNKNYYKGSALSNAGGQAAQTLIEITDTGFKVIGSVNNSGMNHSGSDYSYYAISGSSSTSGEIKTWCVFDGTGTDNTEMTIKAGANVASVLKISDGIYKVTMTNPMPSEHYSVSVDCNPWGYKGAYGGVMDSHVNGDVSRIPTATEFHIDVRDTSNVNLSVNRITFHVVC